MGNCCKCKRKSAKKIVLLLVGLDNAGKTVAVKGLAGENTDDSIPTVGFSVVNLNYLDYNVQIYDLGGGPDIRDIWHRYFVDAHGVIFVVDASDYDRFNEVKSVLQNLLSHRKISGKPLLVLANKQDNQEALDEIDIVENLGLEDLVNEKKCPTLVESCSAKEINQNNNKVDPGIANGYRWLLNYILKDYVDLNRRVEQDVQEQKRIDDEQRRERIERLKIRSISEVVDNDQTGSFDVDPFRPISELVSDNNSDKVLYKRDRVPSVKSVTSCVYYDKSTDTVKDISADRPKSAVQIVKKQLEKSTRRNGFLASFPSNKTAPITLLSPKSAPVNNSSLDREEVDGHFRSSSESGQILTVTELPNAIIDSNGENIGDLFELNNFSTTNRKLPPIRQKSVDDYAWMQKPMRNSVNVMQTNIDEIYKDIS